MIQLYLQPIIVMTVGLRAIELLIVKSDYRLHGILRKVLLH